MKKGKSGVESLSIDSNYEIIVLKPELIFYFSKIVFCNGTGNETDQCVDYSLGNHQIRDVIVIPEDDDQNSSKDPTV